MPRILITEDDKFMANLCRIKFEEQGFETLIAHDGRAAIELLKNHPLDLVILDLILPEIDGIGVLRFIRSNDALRGLPVIVLSNSTYFSGIAQSAWNAGATNFLHKGDHNPVSLVEEARRQLSAPPPPSPSPPPMVRELPPVPSHPARPYEPYVLIVDDDNVIHGVLTFFINQAGFRMRSAFNGRRALEMAAAEPPLLMVLDGMMPELNGFEVLERWSVNPRLSSVPVIMLTAEKSAQKHAGALSNGAVEYLTKPFSPDRLVQLVNQYALCKS